MKLTWEELEGIADETQAREAFLGLTVQELVEFETASEFREWLLDNRTELDRFDAEESNRDADVDWQYESSVMP